MGYCQEKFIIIELNRGECMIVYDKLWLTMKEKGISQYALIKKYKISTGQLDRLRKNDNVSTHTLNLLCTILDCKIEDIAEFKAEFKDE